MQLFDFLLEFSDCLMGSRKHDFLVTLYAFAQT